MQTKSQDAQNPGLWVNGNRMPVQEAMDGITKPLTNKVINKDAQFTNPDTGKALGDAYMSRWQERRDDEDKGINHENETPVDYTERKHEEGEDFVGPPSKLSGHNLYTSLSDQKKKPMQENTNRSVFLTHLQGMQTKSQDAQNPGLWVNGNRMPMHENSRLRKIMKDDIEKSNLSWTPRDERVARRLNDTIAPGVGDTQKRKSDIQTLVNRKKILAGAQDLNADGQVSKAEKELVTPQMVEVPDIDQLYPNRTQEDFLNHFLALNDRFNRPNINPDS